MKVLLIIPSHSHVYGFRIPPVYPSLGILYIASMLESYGHDVQVIDIDADELDDDRILQRIGEFEPGIVGFSCVTPTLKHGLHLAALIKGKCPSVTTVMGGIHPTIAPEETIAHQAIDIITIGEAEHTIVELVAALENNLADLDKINGICFERNGSIIRTPPRELEKDLDLFPFPAIHLIGDLKRYSPGDARGLPAIPMMISRGCSGRCTYCCVKNLFGTRFRIRTVPNILAEVDLLVNTYGAKEIHFLDDSLTTNKKRILELCGALAERDYPVNYQIPNGIRADIIDREMLLAFRSIGITELGFGVESGNEEVLKDIKKGITKDQFREAMALAKELGFETWGFFLIGFPTDTGETIKETIRFAIELDPCFAKFLILKPFPGSEVFEDLRRDGLIDSFDYDRYGVYTPPVHHLPSLSAAEILAWQKKAFRKFYFRPRIILKHITRIKSLVQLKIDLKGAYFVLRNVLRMKRRPGG